MPLLRISALHKYYGDHHVLKGIDLSVEEGQEIGRASCRERVYGLV